MSCIFVNSGINVTIEAFTDVSDKIYQEIISTIFKGEVTQGDYDQIHEMTKNMLKEKKVDQPYIKANDFFYKIVRFYSSYYIDLELELPKSSIKEFSDYLATFRKQANILVLTFGHLTPEKLTSVQSNTKFYLKPAEGTSQTISKLSKDLNSVRALNGLFDFKFNNEAAEELNNTTVTAYQIGKRTSRNSLLIALLNRAWGNIFYYELRTVQQLGYIVFAGKAEVSDIQVIL